jgi:hypothetical protein
MVARPVGVGVAVAMSTHNSVVHVCRVPGTPVLLTVLPGSKVWCTHARQYKTSTGCINLCPALIFHEIRSQFLRDET